MCFTPILFWLEPQSVVYKLCRRHMLLLHIQIEHDKAGLNSVVLGSCRGQSLRLWNSDHEMLRNWKSPCLREMLSRLWRLVGTAQECYYRSMLNFLQNPCSLEPWKIKELTKLLHKQVRHRYVTMNGEWRWDYVLWFYLASPILWASLPSSCIVGTTW
jgi:hypothetical protein